jgi:alpha-mannosidase
MQDRFLPRMDQGERIFRFWVNGGKASERLAVVDREALTKNESPMVLSCYPPGNGEMTPPSLVLDDKTIQATTMKIAEDKNWLIVRLFEPTGKARETKMAIPCLGLECRVSLGPFEIKTIAVDLGTKKIFESDLIEKKLKKQGALFKTE